jgi:hypothetical protein
MVFEPGSRGVFLRKEGPAFNGSREPDAAEDDEENFKITLSFLFPALSFSLCDVDIEGGASFL